jgi:uncharacterized protein involved in tolerance to divalent cations
MTNLERLKMECAGINLTDDKLSIYLEENDLTANDEYAPSSKTNKKNILKTALSILESIANNISNMKNYKTDDISISQFSENLNNRIDALDRKIRLIPDNEGYNDGAGFIYMFK